MIPWAWLAVGFLAGATIGSAVAVTVRHGSNALMGFVIEVGTHLWTLAVAGMVAASFLWILEQLK